MAILTDQELKFVGDHEDEFIAVLSKLDEDESSTMYKEFPFLFKDPSISNISKIKILIALSYLEFGHNVFYVNKTDIPPKDGSDLTEEYNGEFCLMFYGEGIILSYNSEFDNIKGPVSKEEAVELLMSDAHRKFHHPEFEDFIRKILEECGWFDYWGNMI